MRFTINQIFQHHDIGYQYMLTSAIITVTLVTGCPSLQAAATPSSVGRSLLSTTDRPEPASSAPPRCLQVWPVKMDFGSNPAESVEYF